MRIVHIDFDDLGNPIGGGQSRRTFEINRRLAARHQVTVYTSRYPGSRDQVIDGIRYRRVGLPSFPGNFLAFFLLMPFLALKSRSVDVLVEDFTSPFTCGLTPVFTRTPVVGSAQYFFARNMAAKYGVPIDVVERYGIRVYDHVVTLTEKLAAEVRLLNHRATVRVIPQGVEPQFFSAPLIDSTYIAYLGRIDLHHKGLDLLLTALANIPRHRRPPLRIFGAGRDVAKLLALIDSLDLGSDVAYMGKITGDDRIAAMAGARYVCVPSRYETFAIVVAEALAAGKPVLGTEGIGFEEIFGGMPCGRLVPTGDVRIFSDALLSLWANKEECRLLGQAGRERARAFDWDVISATQENFYESASRR